MNSAVLSRNLPVTMAGIFTAAFAGLVAVGAGFTAVIFAFLVHVVAFADLAFAVGAGT